ncbi:MAG: UvrD-helicase domain-containing protein [Lachnospiraceae bacterium]|nr:UvrD-helicase domain-containing protein [Lachnospiraceae bacterium]
MNLLENLNPEQQRAVTTTEGPLLILAGAGSGKTRVLVHRVANLMANGVEPYHIMAITFTNKAAGEMRQRINDLIGMGAEQIWVATFHSSCVRILRRFGDRIGYGTNFSIYDTDDTKTVMKEVLKKLNIDTKKFKERYFLNAISSAKNEMITAEEYALNCGSDLAKSRIAGVYREYQARMRANNAMDFDDLLVECVNLLKQDPEVLTFYQNKFQYIMVDEYQDTNTVQFELVRLLAGGRQNLCVVGDDDQSIYKFRGANIYNILNFEQHFPDACVIKLEQNYRSTKFILDTANGVIANNEGRKEKRLWTDNAQGERVKFKQFDSAYEEAQYIAMDINSKVRKGTYAYKDCAVLYRTNAQSRLLEEKFIVENIPYKIVGGVNFYSRKEVKDILAYLKTVDNAQDDLAVRRIINVPKRGIGATSIERVADYSALRSIPFYDALLELGVDPTLKKLEKKVEPFVLFIQLMRSQLPDLGVAGIIREIIDQTGYEAELEAEGTDEATARIENIEEFYTKAVAYEQEHEDATLSGFLEEVALIADIDSLDESEDYVVLMTLHAAKGLEFPNVYMAGMEDGLFPSYMSITADDSDAEIEEERRLCYVGITRAMKQLTMTSAKARMVRGETQYGAVSRFVKEIPSDLLDGEVYEQKQRFFPDFLDDAPTQKINPIFTQKKPMAATRNFGTKIEKKALDYGEGDRVRHPKFGEGEVISINDGGRDFEVTVEFDTVGRKKMFASFAKMTRV